MKVAVIIDTWFPFVGGGQINAWEISKIIAKKGNKIDIITRNNGKTNVLRAKNLKVIRLGSKSLPGNTISQIKFAISAIFYLLKGKYDVIHAHAFIPGFSIFAVKLLKGTPTIFTVHGTSLETNLLNPVLKLVENIILTKISYGSQITVSRDFLKIPNINKNVNYIPNATNIKQDADYKSKSHTNRTLLFVGKLAPQKNVINLIEAFSEVCKEIKNAKLKIVGVGPQKQEIINRINKLKLNHNVKLLGQLKGNSLVAQYKSASYFILPSFYEGQSLALLEAFAFKLVPIVSSVGDNPYLIKDHKNGFLIKDSNNLNQIKQSITRALHSKKLKEISQNNYEFVMKNFSWQKSALKTLKIYNELGQTK